VRHIPRSPKKWAALNRGDDLPTIPSGCPNDLLNAFRWLTAVDGGAFNLKRRFEQQSVAAHLCEAT